MECLQQVILHFKCSFSVIHWTLLRLLVAEKHKAKFSKWDLRISGEYWISIDMMHAVHTWCSHTDTNSRDKYQWLWTERMASGFLMIGMIILTQTVVGILGNCSLLCSYIILHFMGYRLRSTDLILKHQIVANSLVLLCNGVSHTMAVFGWKHICSDFGLQTSFCTEWGGECPSVASASWVSFRWSRSVPGTPGGQRWK